MRLIDADALRADAITRSGGTEFAFDNCYPFWQFSQAIAQAPTIEAAPVVHGEWSTIEDDYAGLIALQCSECNQEYWFEDDPPLKIYNYCPNCGARMDGDGNA